MFCIQPLRSFTNFGLIFRGDCWLFQTKGEIRAPCYLYDEKIMSSLTAAIETFKQIFLEQTGNLWEDRNNFKKIPGKMTMLDLDYEAVSITVIYLLETLIQS